MMAQSRRHHYIPQFYLAGFTQSGSKDDRLWVFDKQTRNQWSSRPSDAGCEHDLYVIESDEIDDPDALEKFLSRIESDSAPVIRSLLEDRRIPEGEDYVKLIRFVALMAARVPGAITPVANFFDGIYKTLAYMITESKSDWECLAERTRAEGNEVDDVTYEQVRDFVRSEDCMITTSQDTKMSMVLFMFQMIEQLLMERQWTLVLAPGDGPNFLCSDRPVILNWMVDPGQSRLGPGFGLTGTMVMFPISKDAALLGIFEDQAEPAELNPRFVATVNGNLVNFAQRFIYTTSQDFAINLGGGNIGGRQDLIRLLESVRDPKAGFSKKEA